LAYRRLGILGSWPHRGGRDKAYNPNFRTPEVKQNQLLRQRIASIIASIARRHDLKGNRSRIPEEKWDNAMQECRAIKDWDPAVFAILNDPDDERHISYIYALDKLLTDASISYNRESKKSVGEGRNTRSKSSRPHTLFLDLGPVHRADLVDITINLFIVDPVILDFGLQADFPVSIPKFSLFLIRIVSTTLSQITFLSATRCL